ncbi:hypothetical protein GGR56DRAFT_695150 [Xylariaceae sp. FL0804]|nr:hypothetical protein GGR56DRAFT_695150 [Xylariaceae sp. FL0804]
MGFLIPRLFHHDSGDDDGSSPKNMTCPITSFAPTQTDALVGGLDFHSIAVIVSAVCNGFAMLSMLVLMAKHIKHYTNPREQKQILRICLFLLVYAFMTFMNTAAPQAYVYLQAWQRWLEAYALASFLLLLCALTAAAAQVPSSSPSPSRSAAGGPRRGGGGDDDDDDDHVYLALLAGARRSNAEAASRGGGGANKKKSRSPAAVDRSYRIRWAQAQQPLAVLAPLAVATAATQAAATYCMTDNDARFARIWIYALTSVSLTAAVVGVVLSFAAVRGVIPGRDRALAKLLAFKLLIGLQILTETIWRILQSVNPSPLAPSSTLDNSDIWVGLPMLILSVETAIFSAFYHYAYTTGPYRVQQQRRPPHHVMAVESGAGAPYDHDTTSAYYPPDYQSRYQQQRAAYEHHHHNNNINNAYQHQQPQWGQQQIRQKPGAAAIIGSVLNPSDLVAAFLFAFRTGSAIERMDRRGGWGWSPDDGHDYHGVEGTELLEPPAYKGRTSESGMA